MPLALLCIALGVSPEAAREAKQLTHHAFLEYDTGDFDKSLADSTRAYELDSLPAFLFNIAQCHRALHHWEQAEFFYRRYLSRAPRATNRRTASTLLAAVQQRQGKAFDAAAPPLPDLTPSALGTASGTKLAPDADRAVAVAAPGFVQDEGVPIVVVRDETDPRQSKLRWAWGVSAAAAALAALGTTAAVVARVDTNASQLARPISSAQEAGLRANLNGAVGFGIAADALFAGAIGAGVAGAVLFLTLPRNPTATTSIALGPSPSGLGLAAAGRF